MLFRSSCRRRNELREPSRELVSRTSHGPRHVANRCRFAVYGKFFRAAKGHITVPLLLSSLVFMQGAQVLGSYWLVFWSEDEFNTGQGFYM